MLLGHFLHNILDSDPDSDTKRISMYFNGGLCWMVSRFICSIEDIWVLGKIERQDYFEGGRCCEWYVGDNGSVGSLVVI